MRAGELYPGLLVLRLNPAEAGSMGEVLLETQ